MSAKLKFLFFVAVLIWVAGIFIEGLIQYSDALAFAYPFVHKIYSTVCHQQAAKLIEYGNGYHTLVCARCTGIYSGGLLSASVLLFIPKLRIKTGKFILLAALPMVADVTLYSSGVYEYSKTIAFITGLLFGSVGIVYIYFGLQKLLDKNEK